MKKYVLTSLAVLALSACKTTTDETPLANASFPESNNTLIAVSCDADSAYDKDSEALATCPSAQEGVNEVMHPIAELPLPILVADLASDNTAQNGEDNFEENLWMHIANSLEFNIPSDQKRLDWQRNWYLKHPNYMQRVSKRASPFLYYIVKRLEEENMPLDLALLPIVESAFDPFAYSHGRASGMWQFIPGTGERFGMEQTWWYDGRRDVIASTEGAIAYLRYLHNMFDGNWLHALAAYNSGEGRVQRAIKSNKRANKSTDFWSLSLPKETRAYVPKLLALADILKNHQQYSFAWPSVENAPVVEVVKLEQQIDLAKAASLAGLSTPELQGLNPGFNRWATDPKGPHHLLLPKDRVESFKKALDETPEQELLSWTRHKIRSGESLGLIAKKYHTSIDVIRQVNKLANNKIIAGEHLLVPVATQSLDNYALSVDQRIANTQSKRYGKHQKTYVVKSGDNLWDIARAHKIKLSELTKWNGISRADPLKIGSKLVIWSGVPDAYTSGITRNIRYNVRSGDSLARIANKFNVRINDIVKWNKLEGQKYLQPGQVLKLIVDVTKT